jgi:hypothetical protein
MNRHANWDWNPNGDSCHCLCGAELAPDCDALISSINEAHYLHIIGRFGIQIQEEFQIET